MKTKIILLVLTIISLCAIESEGYKVLLIFPMPARSHMILGDAVARHLTNAGHEVTLITAYTRNATNTNFRIVDVSKGSNFFKESNDVKTMQNILDGSTSHEWMKNFLLIMGNQISASILKDGNFQRMLSEKNLHFDVVIAEWFYNELFGSIGAIYDAPFIWMCTTEPNSMILRLIDEGLNPSYNGQYVTDKHPHTFSQRVQELLFDVTQIFIKHTVAKFLDSRAYQGLIVPHFIARGKMPPLFEEIQYSASLVLGNSHVSMGESKRLPPNFINIGGYHIEEDLKPLRDDIKYIIETAKHGVIYFSMGSHLRSKDLPEALKQELLLMFATLKQTVIWKFEENLNNLPKNVHVLDWATQQSILAHSNVILFITHGGLLSTTEAIFFGKPIIGIPVLGDQFTNVARAVNKGFALKVSLAYDMASNLKESITEILANPKYTERAQYVSLIHHDRPVKPGDELVHWVEHVIKTKGALHLRSKALLVPWYQKMYLDLAVFIGLLLLIIVKLCLKIKMTIKVKKN